MLKVWNMSSLLASCAGDLRHVCRAEGLIQSVHTFAVSAIGPYFLSFLVIVTPRRLA